MARWPAAAPHAANLRALPPARYDGLEGYSEPDCPTLAICCENGRVQLMRGEADSSPVCIDTGLRLRRAPWSRNGAVRALAGWQTQ